MHGLRSSSVLVLDDTDDDALKIQKSLALRGIGSILVPGPMKGELPECSLKGIRVAVLDIHLGFGNDSQSRVQHTRGVVDRVIDKENGPYVAVIWTSNAEDYDLFCEALKTIKCPPILAVKLEKSSVINLEATACAEKILESIAKAISDVPPLDFANLWQQIVWDAANDTIVSLEVADHPSSTNHRALGFFAALLKSEADAWALESDANGMRALLAALNPVHFDKVEERSAGMAEGDRAVVAPIRERARGVSGDLALSDIAKLNTSLSFDRRVDNFGSGRLYCLDEIRQLGIGSALPDDQCVRSDTLERDHLQRGSDLPIVLLEISAACDHQQQKIHTARLLAGVVFDASRFGVGERRKRVNARCADYLRTLEPLQISEVNGFPANDVRIVWNSHFPVSVSVSAIADCSPIGKLREPVLADIRAWLSYQVSRPGYVSVR